MLPKKLLHSCVVFIGITQALMFSRLDATKIIPGAAYFILHRKTTCEKRCLTLRSDISQEICQKHLHFKHDFLQPPCITYHDKSGKCLDVETFPFTIGGILWGLGLDDYASKRLDPDVKNKIEVVRVTVTKSNDPIIHFYDNYESVVYMYIVQHCHYTNINLNTITSKFNRVLDLSKITKIDFINDSMCTIY